MPHPTRDEFDVIDDCRVVHRPSGWEFSTYRYPNPADVRIDWQKVGVEADYDPQELSDMALALLREFAAQRGSLT